MRLRVGEDSRSFFFVLENSDKKYTHTFPRMSIYKAKDPRSAFANQIQRAFNLWEARGLTIDRAVANRIIDEVFADEVGGNRSGNEDRFRPMRNPDGPISDISVGNEDDEDDLDDIDRS